MSQARPTLLSRYSDVLLAFGVVVIVGSMIVPVPPKVMDYLIATNIGISVAVLLAALYVPDASRLPSFPTILLLTTLFRLALNVSSTRLILLEANAGEIIYAFGNFVVQGNFVVGGVVFVVLVLVQFIVITKGAERVAEVSARFTLDAMPGKQMSIDAEQRSGAINNDQARRRRQDLERESKLYGAMDGAMKFVKGDAIAGICIAIVNIIGGLIIGMTQMGMPAGEAAQTFSLLTIGDGLVSQIPSLLVGVAAGLVVTRVAGATEEGTPHHVAADIVDQIFGQWRAIVITCVLLCGLAATSPLTGLPWGPFIVLSGVLAFGTLGQFAARVVRGEQPASDASFVLAAPSPLAVALSDEAARRVFPAGELRTKRLFTEKVKAAHEQAAREMGIPLPPVTIRAGSGQPPTVGYALLTYETPVEYGAMPAGESVVLRRPASTEPVNGADFRLPGSMVPAISAAPAVAAQARSKGQTVLDESGLICDHLIRFVRRNSHEFLGIQETRTLFENLEKSHPELVRAITSESFLPFRQTVDVLQELLREQIPIRDLRSVLESLARWGVYYREPAQLHQLVDCIRRDIRRIICDRFSTSARELRFYTVAPVIEQMLVNAMQTNQFGEMVPEVSSEEINEMWQAFQQGILWQQHTDVPPVVMTALADTRRPLRSILSRNPSLAEVVVLCHDEISPGFELRPIAMLGMVPA